MTAPAQPGHPERSWVVGQPLAWTLGTGLTLVVLGAMAGRPDVAVVGVAPVIASLWAVWVRPRGRVWVDVQRPDLWAELDGAVAGAAERAAGGVRGVGAHVPTLHAPGVERGPAPGTDRAPGGPLVARIVLAAPPGTESVRIRVSRSGHAPTEALVDVPLTREIGVSASSVRTGSQELFRVEHQGLGPGAQLTGPSSTTPPQRVLVLPRPRTMPALPLPLRLRGLSGQHESRRPGEGGGLRDIHPFMPGDAPRRIDWKVTARRSPGLEQLYVRRTMALAEAMVVLVVDSRDDVGPDPATWSGLRLIRPDDATSLDLARQAAATVAQGYLTVGDRVGVEDLGVRRRALRPGTGRRQLDRVIQQLALLRPEGDPPRRLRPPRLSPGALVYLFSTFLDQEAADLAQVWRRSGHRVVAVDVLPRFREQGLDVREWLALRIVRIEREDRLAEVVGAGAELLHWADADASALHLQQLARQSHHRPGLRFRR